MSELRHIGPDTQNCGQYANPRLQLEANCCQFSGSAVWTLGQFEHDCMLLNTLLLPPGKQRYF